MSQAVWRDAPLTVQIVSAESTRAVVEVWSVLLFGTTGERVEMLWRTHSVTLVWEDEAWRVDDVVRRDGPTPVLAAMELPSTGAEFDPVIGWTGGGAGRHERRVRAAMGGSPILGIPIIGDIWDGVTGFFSDVAGWAIDNVIGAVTSWVMSGVLAMIEAIWSVIDNTTRVQCERRVVLGDGGLTGTAGVPDRRVGDRA